MRCSACGKESLPGASFCLNCGSALAPAAQTPAPAAGLPAICQVCRGENPPGMKFCRNCGASLAQAAPPPGFGPPPSGLPKPATPVGGAPMMAPAYGTPAPAYTPSPLPGGPQPEARAPTPAPQGSTINCPRCGTNTPLGFTYCQQCGLQLQAVAPTDPGASRARPASMPPPLGQQNSIDQFAGTIAQPGTAASVLGSLPPRGCLASSARSAVARTRRA